MFLDVPDLFAQLVAILVALQFN
ncbi:hypothetical protein PTD2_04951 [Pseudoalteromonas tunicata D2]|uniref:Uncharacterized protein n=1 Tax=Pseudoalteromonas tunicata D2 TaxID=87626 RepID=A4CFX7_9GAMM|nr:hypothetical protein PTD2_04951 [Pseudoalteromonas tunicata D2]